MVPVKPSTTVWKQPRWWLGLDGRSGAPEGPVAAAALLAVGAVGEALLRADGRVPVPLALFLALAATAPVAGLAAPRRPHARGRTVGAAATAAVAAGLLSLTPFHVLTAAGLAAVLLALHRAGLHAARPLAVLLPLPFVGYALSAPAGSDTGSRLIAALIAAGAAAAAGTGLARRARDAALAHDATERAAADTLLAHAARGERARIARELHDVVAHHISMIAVQAETARLTTPGLPAAGADRFLAIGDTARTALTEMRRLLGVLREDAGPAATATERRPQPGIEQLGELVDEARDASGGALRLIVEGPIRPLDAGVELTAYRIVQEALTNARRHAPGAAIDVELRYAAEALRLRVRDNGPSPHASTHNGTGHGLLGMRERATMAGGTLRAGPASGGGFLIEASFPLTSAAAPNDPQGAGEPRAGEPRGARRQPA
ncbi:two-component sensor histidine kinase [Streptomyces venezuelae]|uniref:histidine kinase n=1 Tax=Streptomyces venezuelae TaxID=54571 RepID=A0A5P2C812_STRVZ|nr:two-component sensor histidine kinase [Streptomyces venezuelae]